MLTVTASAREKLGDALQQQAEPEMAIRIIPSPSRADELQLVMDKEREGDQVVETEDGAKLLLMGPELAPALEGVVMDCRETPEGTAFTMSTLA
jgi:Fe-S cluster assembly iron-binding protein IscA